MRLAAPLAGWRTVVAEVGQVPLHWLRVRRADRKRQASAAEGGVRRTIVASARVAVRGPQSLTLAADPAVARGRLPRPGSWPRSSGDGSSRTATASLHGPFASALGCQLRAAPLSRRCRCRCSGDGAYASPAVAPRPGATTRGASPSTAPTPACRPRRAGRPCKVRGRSTVALAAPASAARVRRPLGPGHRRRAARSAVRSTSRHALRAVRQRRPAPAPGTIADVTQRRPGNGTFSVAELPGGRGGWYAWRSLGPGGRPRGWGSTSSVRGRCGPRDPGTDNKKSGLTVCLSDGSLASVTSPSASSTAATRVPQADRTRAMRARLLEATVELLVERGFAGTSTTLVSDRAGVSRGAQLHHFPTKNDLVVAAVEHLTERRGAELAARGGAACRRGGAAYARRRRDARRPLRLTGLRRRARAVGGGPHRRGPARRRRPAGAAGRPRGAPDDGRRARRRRVAAGRARAGAGDPRPGARAGPGLHDHRRLRAASSDPAGVGRRARPRAGPRRRGDPG